MLLALFSPVSSAAASSKETKIQSYVSDMQPGWNLGNTFDALNSWGDPKVVQNAVTKEFIKEIKKQGFKSIRIPITWGEHMGGAPDYKIEPAWMDRIHQGILLEDDVREG